MNRWLNRYGAWVYRNAKAIVIGALILSGLCVVGSKLFLKTQTGILDLYSENNETNRRFLSYTRKFGAVEYLIIVFEGKDQAARQRAMEGLAARLRTVPQGYIRDIFYKVDLSLFKKHAFQFLSESQAKEILEQARKPDGGIRELFSAPDLTQFINYLNASLEKGLSQGAAPSAQAAEEFGKLIQPLLLLRDFLQGEELSGEQITARLEESSGERATLDDLGYLRTDDRKMHVMLIRPSDRKQDYRLAQNLVQLVRKEILPVEKEFPSVTIGVTGGPALNNDQFKISERDMTLASIFAFVSTAILFIFAFKSSARPFLGLATLAINITWVFGFATLTVGHLNLFSLAFVVILVGQGTYYGVHVVARYEEELQKGLPVDRAIQETLSHVFGNVTTSALTTAAAFFATMLVELKGFAELGWIVGNGIILSAIGMQLVLPAMMVLYDRRRPREKLIRPPRASGQWFAAWSQKILKNIPTYSSIGAAVMILLAVGGAYLFYSPQHGIPFDNNLLNLQAKDTEAVQYEKKLIETSLSPRAGIFLASSVAEARRIAEAAGRQPAILRVEWLGSVFPEGTVTSATVEELKKTIHGLRPAELRPPDLGKLQTALLRLQQNLGKVENQALSHSQGEKLIGSADQGIAAIGQILQKISGPNSESTRSGVVGFQDRFFSATRSMLKEAASSTSISLQSLPPELRDRFVASDGTYAVYAFPNVNIWEREPLAEFIAQLREVSPEVTGPPVMFYEILRLVRKDYFRAAYFAALAIFIIFLIDFRSPGYALLAAMPKVLGVFTLFGIMSLLGLSFNTANMIALPMILGIGADNGVHMIHRFREEKESNIDFLFKSTGKALFITYLDSVTSFIGLAFANHQGLAQLGKVVILGITCCTMAGFLVLPAIMLLIIKYRHGRAIAPELKTKIS